MTYHTTIYLSEDHKKWIDEMSLNVSKYVRSLIDRDMQRWKQITEDILIPIVKTEKQLEEKQKTGLDEMFHDQISILEAGKFGKNFLVPSLSNLTTYPNIETTTRKIVNLEFSNNIKKQKKPA